MNFNEMLGFSEHDVISLMDAVEISKEKQNEARDQLERYKKTEEIKMIPKLRSYSVVAVKDELIVEEV